jgi:hypothetical protein
MQDTFATHVWRFRQDGRIVSQLLVNESSGIMAVRTTVPRPAPTDAEARSALHAFGTDGMRVRWVRYHAEGASGISAFSLQPDGSWLQTDGARGGIINARFRQTGSDDWSVYLWNEVGNYGIQLDLHTRQVNMTQPGVPYRLLYRIIDAQ